MKTISGLLVLFTGIVMTLFGIAGFGHEDAILFVLLFAAGIIVAYAGYRILKSD